MSAYTRMTLGTDPSGRPVILNRRTVAMLREVERRLRRICGEPNFRLTILQGSYMGRVSTAASGDTHDGGGVLDIRTRDLPANLSARIVVRELRRVGFAAWDRDPWPGGSHIHAVAIGDAQLHPSARRQVKAYRAGRDGLAGNGPDTGPRVRVKPWALVRREVAVRLAQRDLDRWRKEHTAP